MKSFTTKIFMLLLLVLQLTIYESNAQCITGIDFDRSYIVPPKGEEMKIKVHGDYSTLGWAGYVIHYSNGTQDRGSAGVENGIVTVIVYPYSGETDYNARIEVEVGSYNNPECNYSGTLYFTQLGIPSFSPGTIGYDQIISSGNQPAKLINLSSGSSGVTYQWEAAAEGAPWEPILGADEAVYQPGNLNVTTRYRRMATMDGYTKSSNIITVTIEEPLLGFKPSDENYIITHSPYMAQKNVNIYDAANAIVGIVYYDGLGRPMQEVAINGSHSGSDLVRPIVYDVYGREDIAWLSYQRTGNMGRYTPFAEAEPELKSFYSGLYGVNDAYHAFSQKRLESSPLSRVMEEAAPGERWKLENGKTVKYEYTANTVADAVKLWQVDSKGVLSQQGFYEPAQLYVTKIADPDSMIVVEFKDKLGNVLEKWQVDREDSTNVLRTSYIFDDWNRLRVVIPPKAQDMAITSDEFNALVYRYTYDARGRVVEKKLPDSEIQYFVYDSRDRLVMFQDAELRPKNQWKVTLYDELNRPVADGIVTCARNVTHASLQTCYNGNSVNQVCDKGTYKPFKTVCSVPALTDKSLLSQTFYDNYEGDPNCYDVNGCAVPNMTTVKGQVTFGTRKVLNGKEHTSSAKTLCSTTYYDDRYRAVQVQSDLFDGGNSGKTTICTVFAFDGNPEIVAEQQQFAGQTTNIKMRYEYDHLRRPTDVFHHINSEGEVRISHTEYDALGRASSKKFGNNETVEYAYNIRDWLTNINSNHFWSALSYSHNGNITKQINSSISLYDYVYDNFGRLYSGIHTNGNNEKDITYDKNGNILTLVREGSQTADLTYNYFGNRLTMLNGNAYKYDRNGNTTHDGLRGFDIQYNLLNLPKKVSKGSDNIEYIYDAAGNKLAKKLNGEFVNFYCGSVVYSGDKYIEYLVHPDGLVQYETPSGMHFEYQYNLTDHLGNVRSVVNEHNLELQKTDYYPFGLAHATSSLQTNKYLYNGKEIQDDLLGGTYLGWYDYGARFCDSYIGRFLNIDRFTEKYQSLSSYQYTANDPINNIDINGDSIMINYRGGFLGLGKERSLVYENGALYNKDGSVYTGKVGGFLKQVTNAISILNNASTEASGIISELQNSNNVFTIKKGKESRFQTESLKAGANLSEIKAVSSGISSNGAGGTIFWNPESTTGGFNTNGNTNSPSYIGLIHEMAHASDANKGLLYLSRDYTNMATGITYNSSYRGLLKAEWNAVYRENIVRGQAGLPLRTHYGIERDISTGIQRPSGPRLLNYNNQPTTFNYAIKTVSPINVPLGR